MLLHSLYFHRVQISRIKEDYAEKGDLGIVAQESRTTQQMLFKPAPLTVSLVLKKLREIAAISGANVGPVLLELSLLTQFQCLVDGQKDQGYYGSIGSMQGLRG